MYLSSASVLCFGPGGQLQNARMIGPAPLTRVLSFRCTPLSTSSRCLNSDGERAPAKWQKSRQRLIGPALHQ